MTALTDYQDKVTLGLFAEVLEVFRAHGIDWADDNPNRKAYAVLALGVLADAIARTP
jgi:hypothetical protein